MVVDHRVRQRLGSGRPAAVPAAAVAGCGWVRSRRAPGLVRDHRVVHRRAWAARPGGRPRRSPPCASTRRSPPRRPGRPATPRRWVRRPGRRAPSTTTVTSPRTPSAAHAARSASPARRTSSWVLVSSRHTARAAVRAERLGHRGQRRRGAVRRLEEHHRPRLVAQRGQPAAALPRLARQEALEAEPVDRQPGHRQRGQHGGRTRDGGHRDAPLDGRRDQPVAGVGDRRHPGVGDEQHPLAALQRLDEHRGARRLVALEVGHHPAADARPRGRRTAARSRRVSSAATTSAPASSSASRGGASRDPADRGRREHEHAAARRGRLGGSGAHLSDHGSRVVASGPGGVPGVRTVTA